MNASENELQRVLARVRQRENILLAEQTLIEKHMANLKFVEHFIAKEFQVDVSPQVAPPARTIHTGMKLADKIQVVLRERGRPTSIMDIVQDILMQFDGGAIAAADKDKKKRLYAAVSAMMRRRNDDFQKDGRLWSLRGQGSPPAASDQVILRPFPS